MLRASANQIAWYIERDGATITKIEADGAQHVRVPVFGTGHVDYIVPADMVDELNACRDRIYSVIQAKRRAAR